MPLRRTAEMMDEPKKRSALLHRKTTPVGATGLARRIPLASVILCADPEKVVLDLLQPARRRADLELWSAGWVERNRAAGPALREVEPGNARPAPRVVCV